MFTITGHINMNQVILESLKRIFFTFIHNDKEIYLVGGCVRDLLLGREPKDYDLCTNATPDEVKKILGAGNYRFIDTGLDYGTITIHDIWDDLFFEITTYRVDGKYSDGRHPDAVAVTPSLEEDLKRRDFTVNSFAYNIISESLVMLDESFMDDLKYGIIRCVGLPKQRFEEDALRMLRAFRFAAKLGFTIEPETYEAIKECASMLLHIPKERIRQELTGILLSDNPRYLELIICTGLEEYIFNGPTPMADMLNCPHQNPYHYTDVFHHTLDVIERVPKKSELRWAALFHDIGKPLVKALKPGTTDHYRYIGHAKESERMATELMRTLKFSTRQIELVCKYVRHHDDELAECSMSKFRKALNDIGVDNFLDFMELRKADSSAHCLILQTKYAVNDITKCYERYKEVINNPKTALKVEELDINGYDLMAIGLQGKEIGDALNKLLEKVLEKPELNSKKVLEKLVKEMYYGN